MIEYLIFLYNPIILEYLIVIKYWIVHVTRISVAALTVISESVGYPSQRIIGVCKLLEYANYRSMPIIGIGELSKSMNYWGPQIIGVDKL